MEVIPTSREAPPPDEMSHIPPISRHKDASAWGTTRENGGSSRFHIGGGSAWSVKSGPVPDFTL